MPTRLSKWLAIAALIALILMWRSTDSRTLLAGFAVCAGAVVVTIEAARTRRYVWLLIFLVISLLFNPLMTVTLPRVVFLVSCVGCLSAFLLSLRMAAPAPRLSMASITDRTPGSESL